MAKQRHALDEISEHFFAYTNLVLFVVGVALNGACLFKLRRHRSVFHKFLKTLAVFDTAVVLCCMWMYGLPVVSQGFYQTVFLPTVPFVLPLVQMSIMASVYSTVVMSLERYLRICKFQILSAKAANWCLVGVFAFPIVFYLPKFFEYRYETYVDEMVEDINCTLYAIELRQLGVWSELDWDKMAADLYVSEEPQAGEVGQGATVNNASWNELASVPDAGFVRLISDNISLPLADACSSFDFSGENDTYIRTIKRQWIVHNSKSTSLRRNPIYYQVYCVGLNTLFASLIPLVELLYFNVATLAALHDRHPKPESEQGADKQGLELHEQGQGDRRKPLLEEKTAKTALEASSSAGHHAQVNAEDKAKTAGLAVATGAASKRVMWHLSTLEPWQQRRSRSANSVDSFQGLARKKENRLTRICLAIVWLFIFCHVWKLVPTIYELLNSEDGTELSEWPMWLLYVKHLSHTFIALNSAVNFLIYTAL